MEEFNEEELNRILQEVDTDEIQDNDKFVLKHLVNANKNDVVFKSDLNFEQIKGVVKLMTADRIMKAQSIHDLHKAEKEMDGVIPDMVNLLMKTLVSKSRAGRKEFIDAYKGKKKAGNEKNLAKWIGDEK